MIDFSQYRTALAMLDCDFPKVTGDFDLTYVEFLRQEDKGTYQARLAPIHLHIAKRYRTMTITGDKLNQMMMLDLDPYEAGSYYLAPLDALFTQLPPSMVGKELGFVQAVNFRKPKQWTVRISPATPHLAGPFLNINEPAFSEEELFLEILPMFLALLPINRILPKPHRCRQQGKGFETSSQVIGEKP